MTRTPFAAAAIAAAATLAACAPASAFDVGPPAWGGSVRVATDPTTAAAWTTYPESVPRGQPRRVVLVSRTADGAVRRRTFTAPAAEVVTGPRVAAGEGIATLAWSQGHPGRPGRVRAVRCSLHGCGVVQTVGRPALANGWPAPATDARGRSFVLWRGVASGRRARLQWALTSHGRFGRVHTLGETGALPVVAAEPDGRIAAAWAGGYRGSRAGVRFAEYGRGRRFGRPVALGPGTEPQLVAAGGELVAAWVGVPAPSRSHEGPPSPGPLLVAIRVADAAAFPAPVPVGPDANVLSPSLAANADGRAVLAWGDTGSVPLGAAVEQDVLASVREPGHPFGAPQTLDDTTWLYDTASAAVAPDGTATVAWSREGDLHTTPIAPPTVHAAQAAAGARFGAVRDLGEGFAPHAAPQAGGASVVWSTPRGVVGADLP